MIMKKPIKISLSSIILLMSLTSASLCFANSSAELKVTSNIQMGTCDINISTPNMTLTDAANADFTGGKIIHGQQLSITATNCSADPSLPAALQVNGNSLDPTSSPGKYLYNKTGAISGLGAETSYAVGYGVVLVKTEQTDDLDWDTSVNMLLSNGQTDFDPVTQSKGTHNNSLSDGTTFYKNDYMVALACGASSDCTAVKNEFGAIEADITFKFLYK